MTLDFGVHEFSWREGRPSLPLLGQRETGQRGKLVQAARALYEKNCVNKTSVSAICLEAGLTRELFYYYFPNKNALTEAVLDDYVIDFTESVILWNESRQLGKIPLELERYVHMFRRCLFDENNHERPMFQVVQELGQCEAVLTTAICEMTRYLSDDALHEYAQHHHIEVDFACEMIYSSMFGLVGLLIIDPEISDARLMGVYQQMLHLDMAPLEPPPDSPAS